MTDVHGQHDHGVRSEEDRISTGAVVFVGVASLVIFFIACLVTISYLRTQERERPLPPVPAEIGQSKIGMVEQQLFELATRGERDRAARLERLRSYGWVDRRTGVAHIPIDEAIDLVAKGVRPQPSPAEATRVPGGQP